MVDDTDDGVGGTAPGSVAGVLYDASKAGTPVGVAHDGETWAERFRPHMWREARFRVPAAGTWIDEEPPERIVTRPYVECSYCGSITVARFLAALQVAGTRYSGSDWKYGWPHKFYVEVPCEPYRAYVTGNYYTNGDGKRVANIVHDERRMEHNKFYCTHLLDATDAEFALWLKIATPLLGVHFWRDSTGRVQWSAPRGFQTFGVVGGASAPVEPPTAPPAA